jgi:UDP-N-acetylglucosamine acyltransferase
MSIHPTTIIQGDVQIDDGVEIGPYCVIQGQVRIKKGTIVESHVTLGSRYGQIEIGENNHILPGAVIGGPPQDVGYKSDQTRLKIGNNNVFREFSTVNIATMKGDRETTIGNNCYFMSYTHVGHDCKIGNNVIIANDSHLGGHTIIDDNVTIGGVCAFNQFVRVGKNAFIAGSSVIIKDILPFTRSQGNYAVCRATNKIGLARKGFSREEILNVHKAIRIMLMGSHTVDEGVQRILAECTPSPNIEYFIQFIRSSKRGLAISRKLSKDEEVVDS